jgi:hypothetical protein
MDSNPSSLVAVHQEFPCPSALSLLSAYQESGVSAVTTSKE